MLKNKNLFSYGLIIILVLIIGWLCYSVVFPASGRIWQFVRFQQNPTDAEFSLANELSQCPQAPFIVPTAGWIGVLYSDSILGTRDHSGLDIFGPEGNGITPVYAVFDGTVTRLDNWTSAVVIKHTQDPLNPEQTIWTYYAHMASAEGESYIVEQIPPGTHNLPLKQGTLLGYQGDYNGGSPRPISTHLHFSIIKDDGKGQFLNETDITNTLDPSPYFGMRLNATCADRPPECRQDFICPQ